MITFENPAYLLILLLIIPGIYFKHIFIRRGNVLHFPIGMWGDRGYTSPLNVKSFIAFLSALLFWGGVAAFIIALSGPMISRKQPLFADRGIDLMLVLDESPSMAAMDFPPVNRFDIAREVITQFIQSRENDPVGLVSFGKEAALRTPPTLDYAFFLQSLEDLQIMDLGDGTSMGMGIAMAALHLQNSTARDQAIILLTDGKQNTGEILPETAAQIANSLGIRIYAVGIGKEGVSEFELTDPETGEVLRGTIEDSFDAKLLESIARSTGGEYFSAGSAGSLSEVFESIGVLEKSSRQLRYNVVNKKYHYHLAAIGLLLILLDLVIRKLLLGDIL